MTVRELIEKLSTLDHEAEVEWYVRRGCFWSLEPEDIEQHEDTVYIGYNLFEVDNEERIREGKEWIDYYDESGGHNG